MKKLCTLSLICLALTLSAITANAQDVDPSEVTSAPVSAPVLMPNEHATNLPGTTTFDAPPSGFDPTTASDQDLANNGFPPRPDDSVDHEGLETWTRAVKAAKHLIVPTLEVSTIPHGPIQVPASLPNSPLIGTEIGAYNWAGFVNTNATQLHSDPTAIRSVSADYVVPVAAQADGTCTGDWAMSSTWVGIDGVGSPDVLQAGTESDAYCKHDAKTQYYSAWYEWFPSNPVRITNLPVAPGNDLFVAVWSRGSMRGHAFILNYNTGQYVVVKMMAPDGVRLVGNSAEWVIERPSPMPITNYVSEYFSAAHAIDRSGNKFGPASDSSFPVVMIDDNGQPISHPRLLGKHAIWVRATPSATSSAPVDGGIVDDGSGTAPATPDGVIEPMPLKPGRAS